MNKLFCLSKMDPELYETSFLLLTAVAINKRKEILIIHVGNTRCIYLDKENYFNDK